MEFLIKAAQLITSLSILIVLHELGHFLPAKWFKTRVEKFYLFFNPWFSIFKAKIGDTVYGIGWLPLGGYVKIAGMVDESMDKEQMKKPAEPWEFRAKPTWQRLIIMIGGVTVNLILGFLIYSMVLFVWGKEKLPVENMTYGVYCDTLLHEYGFQDGDKLLMLDTMELDYFSQVNTTVLIDGARKVTLDRNGERKEIMLPAEFDQIMLDSGIKRLFIPRTPWLISEVIKDRPAKEAGLQVGDQIMRVDQVETPLSLDFVKALGDRKSKNAAITVLRDGSEQTVTVAVDSVGKIGVRNGGLSLLETETFTYSFAEAIPAGFTEAINVLSNYVRSMRLVFTKAGAKQIGGFGAIGGMFDGTEWNWHSFWANTALLSLILAFMNILPIPALDGGHVMFLLYEMITGRPPGEKFMEYAQITGMILLLALLLYANGNDIFRWISGG